jgi:hypothetical protein
MSDIDIELPLNEGHIAFAVCELKIIEVCDTPEEAQALAEAQPDAFVAEVIDKNTYNNAIDSEVAALLEGKTPAHDKWVVQQVGNVYLVRRPVNAVAVDEANNDR